MRHELVIIRCPNCGKEYDNPIYAKGVTLLQRQAYLDRSRPIQNILPSASPEIRESLISGLCTDCQTEFFGACE